MERVRASRMGAAATKALIEGKSNVMIGIVNNEIMYTPFGQCIKHQQMDSNLVEMVDLLS
jgi:6-phosphofructokinase 1